MSEELQVVPIEEQISQELVKQNVTEAVIAKLKDCYGHLKINGIEDKETYLLVKEGRKECKAIRVMAKKICEKGREEAVAIQKAWVAKQKEVTDQIAAIEDPLDEQEKAYEAAVAKEKEDRKRRQEEQLIMRQQVLTNMGALYSEGSFHLGEVSFELSVVKESEPDIWEESILPKFKEEYEKVEAERIEQERIKQEREAEMKRQQEELERKKKELEDREAAIKLAQEDQERKQREHDAEVKRKEDELLAKKQAELKAATEAEENRRMDQLYALGLIYDFNDNHFKGFDSFVPIIDLRCHNAEKWNILIDGLTKHVAIKKEEEEQKRLAEIEAQKEAERIKSLREFRVSALSQYEAVYNDKMGDLGLISDDDWFLLINKYKDEYDKRQKEKWEKEQEEKRKQEELLEQQRMEQAKDKEKWDTIMIQLNSIVVYEMRSSQYRKKAMILREKLEEIKAL